MAEMGQSVPPSYLTGTAGLAGKADARVYGTPFRGESTAAGPQ
jgi:hypothetical protein